MDISQEKAKVYDELSLERPFDLLNIIIDSGMQKFNFYSLYNSNTYYHPGILSNDREKTLCLLEGGMIGVVNNYYLNLESLNQGDFIYVKNGGFDSRIQLNPGVFIPFYENSKLLISHQTTIIVKKDSSTYITL